MKYDPIKKQKEIDAAWALYTATVGVIHRKWLEARLIEQKNRCAYCNIRIGISASDIDRQATIDHVVARSKGGVDEFENVMAVCDPCNAAKSNLTVAEYLIHPICIARRERVVNTPPDRLSIDPSNPYFDEEILAREVGIRFNGRERNDVFEYCIHENWIMVQVKNKRDHFGRPLEIKIKGTVEAYFRKG